MPRLAHGSATARNRRLSSPRISRRSRTETAVQAPLLAWSVATAASISAREEARAEPVTIWGLRAAAVVIRDPPLSAASRHEETIARPGPPRTGVVFHSQIAMKWIPLLLHKR